MKKLVLSFSTLFLMSSYAQADACSLDYAQKNARAIVDLDVLHNNLTDGSVVYRRSESREYTLDYLNEEIELIGVEHAADYVALKSELTAHPNRRIYRLNYTYVRSDNLNTGFSYLARFTSYQEDSKCSLASITIDR